MLRIFYRECPFFSFSFSADRIIQLTFYHLETMERVCVIWIKLTSLQAVMFYLITSLFACRIWVYILSYQVWLCWSSLQIVKVSNKLKRKWRPFNFRSDRYKMWFIYAMSIKSVRGLGWWSGLIRSWNTWIIFPIIVCRRNYISTFFLLQKIVCVFSSWADTVHRDDK